MRNRRRMAFLCFVFSGLLLLSAIPYSAAINRIHLDREARVSLTEDKNALLGLAGFDNRTYDLSANYKKVGSITNNTKQPLKLTVSIIPRFQLNHLLSRFGLAIGKESCEFSYSSSAPKQLSFTLAAGKTVEVKAYYINNFLHSLPVEFQFNAADSAGSLTVQLTDTPSTPRRMTIY